MLQNQIPIRPLNVFLTGDIELWPIAPKEFYPSTATQKYDLSKEINTYIYGITPKGNFGLPYILEILNQHGLKAIFFVESLSAIAIGFEPLEIFIDTIKKYDQEVGLHIHSEWLKKINNPTILKHCGQNLHEFSEKEQVILIEQGIKNLQKCGIKNIIAFRAGNFGANNDTLNALSKNGILYDSSYNVPYLNKACKIKVPNLLLQPEKIGNIYEFPIAFFYDYFNHKRPVHLNACSFNEIKTALFDAWECGWHSFVIVFHNFELLKIVHGKKWKVIPNNITIKRLKQLCSFLIKERDKFRTSNFLDINKSDISPMKNLHPLHSRPHHTSLRFIEQFMERLR